MEAREPSSTWPTWKRVGFRVLLIYFVLYASLTVGALGVSEEWLTAAFERFTGPPEVLILLMVLVSSLVISLVWSLVDRKPRAYTRAARWLETSCRLYLGGVVISYGIVKVVPLQMPSPNLATLVAPLGDLTRMGLLWTFMGVSPAYESIAGMAEVLGGVLLFWRRTRLLGATVVAIVMTNVVMLNFFYDVPVKGLSSHLLLMAVALMLLDARRLFALFILNQPAVAADLSPLFSDRRAQVAAHLLKLAIVGFALVKLTTLAEGNRNDRHALWGIHDVESFVRDGEELPPLLTDELRWQALIVDDPGEVYVQRLDGALDRYDVEFDDLAQTMTLLRDSKTIGVLRFEQTKAGVLSLTGQLSGSAVEIRLRERDIEGIRLIHD